MIARFLFQRWENHLSKLEDKKATNNQNELYQNPAESKKVIHSTFPEREASPAEIKSGKLEMKKEDYARTNSPTTDMHNLVSDLNSFLSSTQKEIHTPKSTKKKMMMMAINSPKKVESFDNNHKKFFSNLNDPKSEDKREKWSCQKCTLINTGNVKICAICGASKYFEKPEVTIFDTPEVPHQDDQEEQMPHKGNVLDKVVQFTAMQMIARENPTAKASLTPGKKLLKRWNLRPHFISFCSMIERSWVRISILLLF